MAKLFSVLLLTGLLAFLGCSPHEETPSAPVQVKPQKKLTRVIVPDSVQGRWKAVKFALLDKDTNQQKVFTVEIGSRFVVDEAGLELEVLNFLPYFQMDGTVLTSVSNETRNPAVQVVISEAGQEVFRGWLFSRYPNTHAFQHPRFSFSLVDFVPAT